MESMRWFLTLAFLLLACEDGLREEQVPLPPLVRSTIPADGAENVGVGTIGLSVTFRRTPDPRTRLNVYPTPRNIGDPVASGRTLRWSYLTLEAGPAAYVFLVDGPTQEAPYDFHCFPGAALENHGRFAGALRTEELDVGAVGTLVLAFDAEGENLAAENMILIAQQLNPASAAVARGNVQGESTYEMRFLARGRSYAVVAILDTSGDGRYDVLDDAWGYLRAEDTGAGALVEARGVATVGGRPTPLWSVDNDIVVRPPPRQN